jgi:exodeoxyribonuclease V alpha subunit
MAFQPAVRSEPSGSRPHRDQIASSVERVTFHSADTGFCVLRLKVRGQRDLVRLTGHAAAIGAGEYVEASGVWLNDRNHGLQFKAEKVEATVPTTLKGLEKYLGSGMIKGIGPVYAAKLVAAFQLDVFEDIEKAPERLREVTGIGRFAKPRSSGAGAISVRSARSSSGSTGTA